MSKKLLVGFTALLILLLALWLLVFRPLTDEQRVMELLSDQVSQGGEYQIEGAGASWSMLSPFSLTLAEVSLRARAMPEVTLELESLSLELLPSSVLSLDPSPSVTSLEFRGARLNRRRWETPSRDSRDAGRGLNGSLRSFSGLPSQITWRLEFTGKDIDAQRVLAYLGARFEMRTSLQVSGEFTVAGDDFEAVRHSLEGAVVLTGGPGQLDARGIDSLNRGPVRWARDSGHFVDWPDVFQFQRLDARFDVIRGLDDTRFSLEFENMSLEGSGAIDFFTSEMDYAFELHFASESGQDTFRAGEYVADTPWPIRCVGSFEDSLPCRLNQEALTRLALKLIEKDAKDILSRLFGEDE